MKVLICTPCDSAFEQEGKFTVTGAFLNMFPPEIPCGVEFQIAVRLVFDLADEGAFTILFTILDPDGVELWRGTRDVAIRVPEDGGIIYTGIIVMSYLRLTQFGEYQLTISARGESHSMPFFVRREKL